MSVLSMPIKFLVMIFNFEGSRAENAGFIMFLIYINKVAFFGFSQGRLRSNVQGGANFARSAKKIFLPPPRIFLPPPRQNSRGGQNNSRGGQIIFHSFTEETLDQGGKFMSLFPQNSYKNCLRGKFMPVFPKSHLKFTILRIVRKNFGLNPPPPQNSFFQNITYQVMLKINNVATKKSWPP